MKPGCSLQKNRYETFVTIQNTSENTIFICASSVNNIVIRGVKGVSVDRSGDKGR